MSFKTHLFLFLIVSIFLVAGSHLTAQLNNNVTPPFDIERIKRATVFVMQTRVVANKPVITCVSTGTIVSRNGLILTNAHSTVTSQDCPGDTLMIGLSVESDAPPIAMYRASVIQSDNGLDLALLQINQEFDGRLINPQDLALPFVDLADSDQVQLDETLWITGYPGVGNDPVSEIRTTVLGFTAEPSGGEKSWFKVGIAPDSPITDISGTISGGGAYNRAGQLVGIPTTAPITRQSLVTQCQLIQDTNSDGLVNQNDTCIALGGSINVLRPANFARPLLQSASLQLQVQRLTEFTVAPQTLEQPRVDNMFFASSVSNNSPTNVIDSLPAGNDTLYLFFDYANMTPETVYELRVSIRGVPNPIFSLSPVRWSGGERGLWYIGTSGQPLPNGTYEFTLFIDGLAAAPPRSIVVGGNAVPAPSFRSPVFATIEGEEVFGNGYMIGTGDTIESQFVFNNMQPGITWTQRWFYNGVEIQASRATNTWTRPEPSGSEEIRITSPAGFPAGRYRLELYIEDRLSTLGDFTVAGVREGANPRVFTESGFVIADNSMEAITANTLSASTTTVDQLYARFNWERVAPGTLLRMRWYVDNIIFHDQILPWSNPENGTNYLAELTGPQGVPDGTYRIELLIDNVVLMSEEIQIGIGQLSIDSFGSASGVQFRGRVVDSETRLGIPSLTIIVISEEYSVADYTGQQEQVFALATTDRDGRFQVDRPLQFNAPYSLLIAADGYLPIPADGIAVDEDTPNPFDMTIYLTRD
jgi:hypothetical protein